MLHKAIELGNRLYYFLFDRFFLYPLLRCLQTKFHLRFLNLGYEPNQGEDTLTIINKMINDDDKAFKAHIYLYEKTLSLCPEYMSLSMKRLLEVGCGHGGGIEWLIKAHPDLKEVVGIDRIVVNNLGGKITEGSAECIPYEDNSFDIVLNVESSHLYKDESAFYHECVRVIRPGGYLCWTDIRYPHKMRETLEEAHRAGLLLISFVDITRQVLSGIDRTAPCYDEMLKRSPWIVRIFRDSLRATYCAPGTEPYMRLVKRQKIYACVCWCNSKYSNGAKFSTLNDAQ